jgi:hypothetical protein
MIIIILLHDTNHYTNNLLYVIIGAVSKFRKGENMEPKIIKCECGEFIGVQTENGLIIGNHIIRNIFSICSNCESTFSYSFNLNICEINKPLEKLYARQ